MNRIEGLKVLGKSLGNVAKLAKFLDECVLA